MKCNQCPVTKCQYNGMKADPVTEHCAGVWLEKETEQKNPLVDIFEMMAKDCGR